MLEMVLDRHIPAVIMAAAAILGIVSKCIAGISLKKLTKAAGNMGKSSHNLVRLVRAKFEHACMISDRVQNVGVFVDKYLYEYRVLGLKLYTWRRMEKCGMWLCLGAGILGAAGAYGLTGMSEPVFRYGAAGLGLAILLLVIQMTSDERYQMEAVRNYMVDYLENICAHRYEKSQIRDMQARGTEETAENEMAKTASAKATSPAGVKELYPETEEIKGKFVKPEIQSTAKGAGKLSRPEKGGTEKTPEPEVVVSMAERKEEAEKEKEKKPVSKEVLIREILQEFLA